MFDNENLKAGQTPAPQPHCSPPQLQEPSFLEHPGQVSLPSLLDHPGASDEALTIQSIGSTKIDEQLAPLSLRDLIGLLLCCHGGWRKATTEFESLVPCPTTEMRSKSALLHPLHRAPSPRSPNHSLPGPELPVLWYSAPAAKSLYSA